MNPCKKSFGFVRKSGILMPISALPSPYGIGSFGKSAFAFIDFLDACGQTCWQVLPLNPTSYGDSPYQSPASVAGNPYFIDLDLLRGERLLTEEELCGARFTGSRIDYGWLFETRYTLLRRAYARFTPNAAYRAFCRQNAGWLEDYALFMALKIHYEYRAWTLWDAEHRDVRAARRHIGDFAAECGFWRWVQYEFARQWRAVRAYAGGKGIRIIGDMPIYVAHDSMDVWRAPEMFLLDEHYAPLEVAGCPPDAFSRTGQLWGNPIYDWRRMQEDGFRWWIDRVRSGFALYDLIRIDHFRGFSGYYSIPYGAPTAEHGRWNAAPGSALFGRLREAFPRGGIIAEDLGFITDDVRALLRETGFPGMKVLQFAFYDADSEYLPRMYTTDNCVVYTGTHDSDCTRSWYRGLDAAARKRFRTECPRRRGQSVTDAAIDLALASRANLAVISMQDHLALTNEEGRMNTPAVATGNWSWRLRPRYATRSLCERIREKTAAAGRMK